MWNTDAPKLDIGQVTFEPLDVLYYYDEPLTFTLRFGPALFLAHKVGQQGKMHRYLMCSTFDAVIDSLKNGRLSVRGALDQQSYWIADVDDEMHVKSCWQVKDVDLPPRFLPKSGLGLFSSAGRRLPDTIQESLAFFSVRFTGEQLTPRIIRLGRFKQLVDSVHESVRKIFPAPHLGVRNVAREIDFNIFQPQLSSLVIAIQHPTVDVAKIRKKLHHDIDLAGLDTYFQNFRDDFFVRVDEIVRTAEKGELKKGFAAEHFDTLDQINEIVPSSNSFVERVEFRAQGTQKSRSVGIDERIGARIRNGHKAAEFANKIILGVVIEINDESATFVIKSRRERQVTCILSREVYDNLALSIGNKVRVSGSFTRRSRRDKIVVDGYPERV